MCFKLQWIYISLGILLNVFSQQTAAEVTELTNAHNNNDLDKLYDYILQREYADPVLFPNHQVERKAQRSPSLRLRFGRRSDPDLISYHAPEKRWFGDVHQKPIRSPSLRLRFGRRSDPSLTVDALTQDYNDVIEDGYKRAIGKPQRLRWGRSVPVYTKNGLSEEKDFINTDELLNQIEEPISKFDKLNQILMTLYQNEQIENPINSSPIGIASNEFQRYIRKPGPLRLRWGRNTGGYSPQNAHHVKDEQSSLTNPKKEKTVSSEPLISYPEKK